MLAYVAPVSAACIRVPSSEQPYVSRLTAVRVLGAAAEPGVKRTNHALHRHMSAGRRAVGVTGALVAVVACSGTRGTAREATEAVALPVVVGVTNESFVTRRFELRIGDLVVLDTVVAQPANVTGLVLADTVRVASGRHELVLTDHHLGQKFTARLTARPGPMCIRIGFFRGGTDFRAGNYVCAFL